jgi:U3 small nucleolar ribonucleoprotein protein IMP4
MEAAAEKRPWIKEMRLVFPNSHRINRGNYVVKELAAACRANDITDLIVLHEHRGIPGADSLSTLLVTYTNLLSKMP